MVNQKTRNMVFAAFYLALAIVLNYLNTIVPIIQMPNGGSLELMVIPLFIASYHMGWKRGACISFLAWVVGTMFGLNNYVLSPLQVLFDYIIPFVAVGLGALFPAIHIGRCKVSNIYVGIIGGMLLRYVSQVISGVYFWPGDGAAGSLPAFIFSINYNAGFNAVTLIATLLISPVLILRLRKIKPKDFIGIKD